MFEIPKTMTGAYLPGNSTVEFKEYEIPELKHGEVLVRPRRRRSAARISAASITSIWARGRKGISRL